MAVKIEKRTDAAKTLKLVSCTDDAIDWSLSCSDIEKPDATDHDKIMSYILDHRLERLVFIKDKQPTLFVFKHPHRADMASETRVLLQKQAREAVDVVADVWEKAYVGTEEGLDGSALTRAERRNGRLAPEYVQALEDNDLYGELALAFMQIARADRTDILARAKKK